MASIHKRETRSRRNGKPVVSWRVRWRVDGRMRSATFPTKSEAETFAANVEAGVEPDTPHGTRQGAPEGAPTLSVCVQSWQAVRRVSAARTAAERSLVRRFAPLDDRPVDTLTPSDVRGFVASLVDEGLAAETVSAILRTLRAVLDVAVEDGHLAANPAARVKPPRIVRPPLDAADVYTPGEVRRLVAATDRRYRALVAVLAYTGARWSEAAALTRGDVDLIRGRVHLGHRVVEEVAGTTRTRDGGKTRGSDRWVPLPDAARRELADLIGREQPGPGVLLFATSTGSPLLRGNTTKRIYRPAVEAAVQSAAADGEADGFTDRGIPVRNLRHTAASMMLAAGLPPLDVAHRLGHSRPSTTLDVYARFLPTDDEKATAALDRFLAR